MTKTNAIPAAREIDLANLDQVVGGADSGSTDARKQEQADKLNSGAEFRPGGPRGSTVAD